MKKKIKRILSLALVMMLLGSNNILASELRAEKKSTTDYDTTIQPRSRYLASASSEVTNEGEGVLRIYADFKSFEGVESVN